MEKPKAKDVKPNAIINYKPISKEDLDKHAIELAKKFQEEMWFNNVCLASKIGKLLYA